MSSHSSLHQSIAAVAQAPGHFLHNAKTNGLMKRNSIFSRPASRNSSIDLDTSDLDLTRSTYCTSSPPESTSRPSTSTASPMERSNTDPSTIGKRHSLFRSRRKSSRKNARTEDAEDAEIAPKHFRSDEEYRSHLKKQSISQPFNFQHLSHTRRKHVPGLGTVDESGSFRVQTNPHPVEPVKSRPTTPCLPLSGPGPQHSSSRSMDVTQGRQTVPSIVGRPRATSCQTRNVHEPISQVVGLSMSNPNIAATSAPPPITAQVQHCSPSELKYRAKQPLPALPQRATSQGHPKRMTQDSQLSCSTTSSTDSYRSSQLLRSAGPWTCLDGNGSTVEPVEASWEEDVDFCYEREAESTCDFNWDENEQIDAGFRLSKFIPPTDGSRNSALFASTNLNTSPLQPRRSSVVGHRGFQQARNTSGTHATAEDRVSAQESQDQLVSITEEPKPLFGPEIMHMDASLGSLDDSASNRTGTSFFDDSGALPAPPSSENGHSSVASLSSVPELMPSSYSTSSNDASASTEHVAPHSARQSLTQCDVMRKPSTLSNRAILQAGRVVQRGRVGTPSSTSGRISRVPSRQSQRPLAEGEEATTWI